MAFVHRYDCPLCSQPAGSTAAPALLVGAGVRIVFGGIVPKPARAPITEAALVGMDWSKHTTLRALIGGLEKELVPTPGSKDAAYRKTLLGSLAFKYWVEILLMHNVPLPVAMHSAGVPYARPVSSSSEAFSPGVCPAVPKIQSHRQAAGEAKYSDDNVPSVNCLFAAFVPASVASGSVVSIDTKAALAMEGVVDFVSEEDLTGGKLILILILILCLFPD